MSSLTFFLALCVRMKKKRFVSAAALTVASTQMKGLFGLKFEGSSFVEIWTGVFRHIAEVKPWDAGLGLSAIVVLLLLRVISCFMSF